jgi:hypothetical protein
VTFAADDEDATQFVMELPALPVAGVPEGKATSFVLKTTDGMYMICNFALPYVQDPVEFADTVMDGRLRKAILAHTAWISVDAMGVEDVDSKAAAYRDIGKMIAQLAGPDCLAVYCPELERCNEYDEQLLETLRSDDPLSLFDEPTFAPVLGVHADDQKMIEAVAEARRRWPVFVDAFRDNIDKKTPYLVKAEFKQGDNSEFM